MKRLFYILVCISFFLSVNSYARDKYVIHFVLDGFNYEFFNQLWNQNKMPYLKKMVNKNGAYFKCALSSFPTISPTAYQSFASGLYPGYSGIPNFGRWERRQKKLINYLSVKDREAEADDFLNLAALDNSQFGNEETPTALFTLLGDAPGASVYSSFRKDAKYLYPKRAPVGALSAAFLGQEGKVDNYALKKVMRLYSKDVSEIPRYTLVGLYSADLFGHNDGWNSKEVEMTAIRFDLFVKDFVRLLEEKGMKDETMIIISADHGMHETGKLFKLKKRINNAGISVINGRKGNEDLYVSNRGVSSTQIYSTKLIDPADSEKYWRKFPREDGGTIDLLSLLVSFEETNIVAVRLGPDKVLVLSNGNERALINCTVVNGEPWCAYLPKNGDPLKLKENEKTAKLVDGKPHSSSEWLFASCRGLYPDSVIQLWQAFADGRAGGIYVTAKPPWGFRKKKAGTHGGLIESDMRIPLLIIGGHVVGDCAVPVRSPDVYKLVAKHLGLDLPVVNGVDPFLRKRHEDINIAKLAAAELGLGRKTGLNKKLIKNEIERRKSIIKILGKRYEDVEERKDDIPDIVRRQIQRFEIMKSRLESLL